MTLRQFFLSTALTAVTFSAASAFAQVEIGDARTAPVATSNADGNGNAGDVTITSSGSIAIDTADTAIVTVDSDNNVTNSGNINSRDTDNVTGILVDGSRTGSISNAGTIRIDMTAPTALPDSRDIATGSGRTGILISGASPFTGNVENASSGLISIQGQDSAGIRLANNSSITGDILQSGRLDVFGERGVGIDVLGDVIGNLAIAGNMGITGEDSVGVNVAGDISGGIKTTGVISVSGFVNASGVAISGRPNLTNRGLLVNDGSARQAGSAMQISGNVGQGIYFAQRLNDTGGVVSTGGINMTGSAPAILINGDGTPIAIGRIGQITDPDDPDYNADLLYSFVNEGTLVTDALLDDLDATTLDLRDAHLTDGLNNSGTMRATVYRSGVEAGATTPTHISHARVIVIGGGAIAERINNTGTILARGFEAIDAVYADRDNIQGANRILATAIDIDANGALSELTNLGTISAVITARDGQAVAIRDGSGTLITLNNSGNINAQGINSDSLGDQATNFELIAIDVSNNTSGFTYNQTLYDDPDVEDDPTPQLQGDVLLGSGDDIINIQSGTVNGNIAFGDGNDRLIVTGGANVRSGISDTDGNLEILVTDNSTLAIGSADDFNATNVNIDGSSTYSPFVDPISGGVSLMSASDTITFADGVQIDPLLSTILPNQTNSFAIATAGTLNIDTTLDSLRGATTPFLYNTTFSRSASDPNTLIMTLDLRSTNELGLDNQQAAAFTSAYEALQNDSSLGGAFVQITEQNAFNAAYNQLLPEFAAAIRQFVVANTDGNTGAVGSHLKNARRSQDRPGGAWIEEFVYYADKDLAGLSDQFRGFGFGITGGFDTAFGPFHTVGVNLGFATTEVEDVLGVDEPLDVLSLQAGLYAGYETGNLGIDLYAGGGYNDFGSNRNVKIGSFDETAKGDWSGTHYNASATAGYDLNFGKYYMRPSVTASYLSLSEKAYQETGNQGIALALDKRTSELGTATAMLEFGAKFVRPRESWWSPSFKIGLKNDFIGDGLLTTGRFVNGTTPFSIAAQQFPETGMILGVTFAAGSRYSSFSLDYDADIRNGFNRHTLRMVLRLLF